MSSRAETYTVYEIMHKRYHIYIYIYIYISGSNCGIALVSWGGSYCTLRTPAPCIVLVIFFPKKVLSNCPLVYMYIGYRYIHYSNMVQLGFKHGWDHRTGTGGSSPTTPCLGPAVRLLQGSRDLMAKTRHLFGYGKLCTDLGQTFAFLYLEKSVNSNYFDVNYRARYLGSHS